MRMNIAVITAPRGRSVVYQSLESLRAIGGFTEEKVVVSSDGRCDDKLSDYADVIVENERPLGNFRNWVAALELGITLREADYVMVCEDDIVWAAGSRDALARELSDALELDTVGAASLYLPQHEARHIRGGDVLPSGWHLGAHKGNNTWGAQCLVFSTAKAVSLLSTPSFREKRDNPKWQKNVDGIVASCLNDRGRTISYRVPCLVNHEPLGYGNSSLGYADERPSLRTRYFTGRA